MESPFPFHQGRFQGPPRPSACFGSRRSFHSTKEGFKDHMASGFTFCSSVFPFHQGRFQGTPRTLRPSSSPCAFPFHQGRFQGTKGIGGTVRGERVSIPPRKVSRSGSPAATAPATPVSIPPRKVSRLHSADLAAGRKTFPFHQGRFQGAVLFPACASLSSVSIPPRKVSRGTLKRSSPRRAIKFPFHQGRFQGRDSRCSDFPLPFSFHSTKEGFKVGMFPT